jgi:hypothetical protein
VPLWLTANNEGGQRPRKRSNPRWPANRLNSSYRFRSIRIRQNLLDLDTRIGDVVEAIANVLPEASPEQLSAPERRRCGDCFPLRLALEDLG